ncbi:ABC-three component system middle component 1 [Sporosarcina sp. HYO08]|uniref:ABC-three component system middle component 1 n=1 Tax=Sporosarcina sp. HYO08 TaxID=1759557 RepID=UPI000799FE0B|nr:ABC-three component system middle component 1 [Sporosarcina sp. HYO08]KXH86964.1 hypothetical protein AU377_13550 [Sporosarcina sp. HYO08]
MDIEKLYLEIDKYFEGFGLYRVDDDMLKKCDCYYIDEEAKKYIFICKVFTSISDVILEWERSQDEDIALYLQQEKYANSDIRWDMYFVVIYLGNENLDKYTFDLIEQDKFCCKKLIIDMSSNSDIIAALNNKLPFSRDYFRLGDITDVFNDATFLKELNNKSGLENNVLTLDLLNDLPGQKEELIKRLLEQKEKERID